MLQCVTDNAGECAGEPSRHSCSRKVVPIEALCGEGFGVWKRENGLSKEEKKMWGRNVYQFR